MDYKTTEIDFKLSQDFIFEHKNSERVFILLHGFQLDAQFIYKFFSQIKELKNDSILAPNGPYLSPFKKRGEFYKGYAWYFFDSQKSQYLIPFDPAISYIKQLVKKLKIEDKKITLIGYSQGGYIAPAIAYELDNVDSVIGIACCFRNSKFSIKNNINYIQIHSKADLVVDYNNAFEEHVKLTDRGARTEWISLEDSGHKLDIDYLEELRKLLSNP